MKLFKVKVGSNELVRPERYYVLATDCVDAKEKACAKYDALYPNEEGVRVVKMKILTEELVQ